jgi:phage protein D
MPIANVLPLNVYAGQDFYVPAFRLMIRGKDAEVRNNDVISVTYEDSLDKIDSFNLTVMNWDPEKRTFKYSDSHMFDPGQEVELFMGYYQNGNDELQSMLIGRITTLSPNFPAAGNSTLTVTGLNVFDRFRTSQMVYPFVQKTDTEIAQFLVQKISAELNKDASVSPKLKLRIDPADVTNNAGKKPNGAGEKPIDYLLVNNQYPILFLMERARRIGYELTLKPFKDVAPGLVTFGYGPTSAVKDPTYVLEWGKTLISLQPNLQMANQVSKVTVKGWDPTGKAKFEATITRAQLAAKSPGILNPSDLGVNDSGTAQKQEIVVDHPIQKQDEANSLAEKILTQICQRMVEAKGRTVGLPGLRAGVKVQIKGLGNRFSGPLGKEFSYLVTSTSHTIGDGGYTTDFTARMELTA